MVSSYAVYIVSLELERETVVGLIQEKRHCIEFDSIRLLQNIDVGGGSEGGMPPTTLQRHKNSSDRKCR